MPSLDSTLLVLLGRYRLTIYSDGTLVDARGELFIKPCTAQEVGFYESSNADHPEFAEFMPTFIGTLTLSSDHTVTFEEQGAALIAEVKNNTDKRSTSPMSKSKTKKIVTDTAIVLENASAGFKRPNILDVKLGVRLWADDAAQDKKDRFNIVTEQTTHKKFGFRIAGMRVWQGANAKRDVDTEGGFKIYDKDYGRFTINNDNVVDAFRNFIFTESAGIDKELGQLIAKAFVADLERIQAVLENQESRMYSASLLFVFEGDGEALRYAMEEASKPLTANSKEVNGLLTPNGTDEEGEEEDSDEEEYTGPKIYSVKLIDFAHAEWVPGTGPDENSLLGVRSVIQIMKDLAHQA
jgi:1D-myo-inositol-tetrakisphosphate 5-kinase/inositol-polyphosphate multikinase